MPNTSRPAKRVEPCIGRPWSLATQPNETAPAPKERTEFENREVTHPPVTDMGATYPPYSENITSPRAQVYCISGVNINTLVTKTAISLQELQPAVDQWESAFRTVYSHHANVPHSLCIEEQPPPNIIRVKKHVRTIEKTHA